MTTLVTGASGCIGAWTVFHLIRQGQPVVAFDLVRGGHRLDYLLTTEEQQAITFVQGDLSDFATVNALFEAHDIQHIVHLAALQVPFCRADPVKGAQVNVVGTVNLFEAARQHQVGHLAYASSIAVFGAPDDYDEETLSDQARMLPRTLYGVYKQANEGTARVYFNDYGISSTGLRPFTVYGVGRDQGLTSDPTKAMLHAAIGQPFHIGFGGRMQMQLASDVAQQFIQASQTPLGNAYGFNMGGLVVSVAEIATIIQDLLPTANITFADQPLPFPESMDDSQLRFHLPFDETPLRDGIAYTIGQFQKLLAENRITV